MSTPAIIRTRIWQEEAEAGNPYATRVARCRGYDVFGELVGQARWVDMLLLLLRGGAPAAAEAALLEALAVALANPGPRDPSVHAAMAGGVGGSHAAACLMAALAPGAGSQGGGRDVFVAMEGWESCGTDLNAWRARLEAGPAPVPGSPWPAAAHAAGFDPFATTTTLPVQQLLATLCRQGSTPRLRWLAEQRAVLEAAAGLPLAISGVAAAAYADLGFTPAAGEMLHLLLRLPGAAAHALEQRGYGFREFPFGQVALEGEEGA